jgi:phage terminase large subunit-like protein
LKLSLKAFAFRIIGLSLAPFHREMCDLIENNRHVVIMAPRQHGKSEIGSIAQALWRAYYADKPIKIVIVSNIDLQSGKILARVRDLIETNPALRSVLMPNNIYKEKWAATMLHCKNGVTIEGYGLSPKIRGLPINHLILDDVLRDDTGSTSKTKKLFREVVLPTINATKGTLSVVGTPQSKVDLLHDLLEKENGWAKARYQAVSLNHDGSWKEPLWPRTGNLGYTIDELRKIQATMDSVSWSKEMMCNPVSGSASLYPWDLIKDCIIEGLGESGMANPNSSYYLGADVSVSSNPNADFSVFTVGEQSGKQPLRIVHIIRVPGKTINEQGNIIRELDKKYNFNRCLVEQNGISYDFVRTMQKDPQLGRKVEGFLTTHKNKERILGAVEISFRNKNLFIPKNETLIEELLNFGIKEREDHFGGKTQSYEGLGSHDDCVMSLALCVECASTGAVKSTVSFL